MKSKEECTLISSLFSNRLINRCFRRVMLVLGIVVTLTVLVN